MEIDFWLERWSKNEIGFHQQTMNPYLAYFYGDKGPAAEQREKLKVFVPLCGKSRDMLWLSQNGYKVFGVECSERAVKDFFEENALNYKHAEKDEHSFYQTSDQASVIEIFQGDFFSLQKNDDIVQNGNTSHMLWKIDEIIEYISKYFTLKIGDIIFTGTPAGVGKVIANDKLNRIFRKHSNVFNNSKINGTTL